MTNKTEQDERLAQARELVKLYESGAEEEADRILDNLTRGRDASLFQKVGELTRELHEALSGFQVDSRIADLANQDIPDARERLNYVVSMTEEAAHTTLGAVEQSLPVAEKLGERARHLDAAWQRFRAREMSAEQFRELSRELDSFFTQVIGDSDVIRGDFNAVMMAQGSQDLSGQIIRRVVALVQELEEKLVELVRITGLRLKAEDAPADNGNGKGHGPAVPGVDNDVVHGQDEVDNLLSSLGF